MVNYKAGETIGLAGIPKAKLESIAIRYVFQNLASVGATKENYDAIHAISARVTGSTIPQQIGHLEKLRAEALRGKPANEAAVINKNYDLALAYYGMCKELKESQAAGGGEAYKFPHLSSRLADGNVDHEGSYAPAGAWRAEADAAVAAQKKEKRGAILSAMAPIDAAIHELPAGEQGAVRSLIIKMKKEAIANGSDNLVANMREALSGKTSWSLNPFDNDADTALKVITRAEEIAAKRGNSDIFLQGTQLKVQKEAAAKAAAARLHGTKATHYGDDVLITPDEARNTARVAILSAGFGDNNKLRFNANRVNEILAEVDKREITGPYTNAELRYLHDAKVGATDQNEKNALTAVIGILTLENKFAQMREAGKKSFKMFANNTEVVEYYKAALANAGEYAVDDTTVAASPTIAGGGAGGGDTATRTGFKKVYGRKDGTPPPPEDEVPTFNDQEQVRALQRSLGLTGAEVDGMYGPQTHALVLAAAQKQNKQPKEFDFTLEGIFDEFIAALTGASAGTDQASTDKDKPEAATDLKTQLAKQLAAVASISDTPLTLSELSSQRKALTAALKNSGLSAEKLTEFEACSNVDFLKGTCTNDILGGVEKALGLNIDSKPDPKLIALLSDPTAGPIIASAINAGSITAVASAAGAEAPSGAGAGGKEKAR